MVGPFAQYEPPGVYTRTLIDNTIVTLQGGLRIPVLIGVGSESLSLTDYEIVRGSSSTTDNIKSEEDVSTQFTGLNREFTTSLFPVVIGNGDGAPTFDPKDVKVSINGQPVGVAQVSGPTGKILLSVIPRVEDKVTVSYYFKRTDTRVGGSLDFPEKDDLSLQVNGTSKEFKVSYSPIVDGSNGGLATTDATKVEVTLVRGNTSSLVTVLAVNGQAGTITLTEAPQAGDKVLASYWTNRWQDTFDYLPVENVTDIVMVGTGPTRNDFTNTLDFVVKGNKIHWGNAFDVANGFTSQATGSVPFKDQVNGILYDNRAYMRPAEGNSDGSNKEFFLEYMPTEGTGKASVTNRTNLVSVYVGNDVSDARAKGPVDVALVEGILRKLVLSTAPLLGQKVYATYWYNILRDDTYTLVSKNSSTPLEDGEYEITSANTGDDSILNMFEDKPSHSVQDPNFGTEGIKFPVEGFDGVLVPGYAKEETILLNFTNDRDFLVLSSIGADGSNGTGTLGQTYIDAKTGTRLTVLEGDTYSFQAGDLLEFDIIKTFKTGALPHLSIPGIKISINDLAEVIPGNTCLFSTFNKNGQEPKVGDFYFVSLRYAKTDFPIKVYTRIRDVVSNFGEVNTSNRLSLGASLAFSNGAIALALAQVLRDASGIDASPSSYFEVLKTLESPISGTNIKPDMVCAITTQKDVINEVRLHCEKMSTIRNKSERTGVFGFSVGTTPEQAQQFARNLKSERLIALYPDGAVIGLIDQFGNVNEAAVDGSFIAAAFTGLAVNPIFDVATPLTHKTITGFRRLVRSLDSVTMNQTAVSGITILEDLSPNLLVRQAMTTNPATILTREPTVVFIKDYVQKQIRAALDPFIGIKFLPSVMQDVEASVDNLLNQLVNQQIITAFKGTTTSPDDVDPTILLVETFYSPVLPLNWIVVNLNLRVRL